jgi:hypothetical protein
LALAEKVQEQDREIGSTLSAKSKSLFASEVQDYLNLVDYSCQTPSDLIEKEKNPARKQELQNKLAELEASKAEIYALARRAESEPANPQHTDPFKQVLKEKWANLLDSFADSKILVNIKKLGQAKQASMIEHLKIDREAALRSAKEYIAINGSIVDLAQDLIDDPVPTISTESLATKIGQLKEIQCQVFEKIQYSIANPDQAHVFEEIKSLMDRNDRLIAQVQRQVADALEPLESQVFALKNQPTRVLAAVEAKDEQGAAQALDKFNEPANTLTQASHKILQILNPEAPLAKQLESHLQSIDQIQTAVTQLVPDVLADPTPKKLDYLSKLSENFVARLDPVQELLKQSVVAEFVNTTTNLVNRNEGTLGRLYQAAKGGSDASGALQELRNTTKRLNGAVGVARWMAPADQQANVLALTLAKEKLAKLQPSIENALVAVSVGKDAGSKEVAEGLLNAWEACAKEVQSASIGPDSIFNSGQIVGGASKLYHY